MKLFFLSTCILSSLAFLASNLKDVSSSFKYSYQIKANSFSPRDNVNLYYYKEKLIDKYEEIAFTLKEEYLSDALRTNISAFKFDDTCFPSYSNGSIILTIGKGKGTVVEGKLRQNICDEDVIREKIYIFDIFK